MPSRILPREDAAAAVVTVVVVADDKLAAASDDAATPGGFRQLWIRCARSWTVTTPPLRRAWVVVVVVVSALLCGLAALQLLDPVAGVDIETIVGVGRVGFFLAAYVGTWAVLVRVYQWINTTGPWYSSDGGSASQMPRW